MPGDIGPFEAQWNLRPKIEALRAEAKSLRAQNNEHYRTTESELAIQRDRLARQQYGAEQQAKSADIQVRVEQQEVQRISAGLAKREAGLAAAEKRGDHAKAAEDREDIDAWRAELAMHEARARQATLDAAELREEAAGIDRRRVELKLERDDVGKQAGRIEAELDKMERQADLLQQARLKYAEADLAGDDIPKRAALELEAEALVQRASAIEVDRDVIRTLVPDLPDIPPGFDGDPGPLPPGSGDEVSSTGEQDMDDETVEDLEAMGIAPESAGDDVDAMALAGGVMLGDESFADETFAEEAFGGESFAAGAANDEFLPSTFDAAFRSTDTLVGETADFDSLVEPVTAFHTTSDSGHFEADAFEAIEESAAPPDFGADQFATRSFAADDVAAGTDDSFAGGDFSELDDAGIELAATDDFDADVIDG